MIQYSILKTSKSLTFILQAWALAWHVLLPMPVLSIFLPVQKDPPMTMRFCWPSALGPKVDHVPRTLAQCLESRRHQHHEPRSNQQRQILPNAFVHSNQQPNEGPLLYSKESTHLQMPPVAICWWRPWWQWKQKDNSTTHSDWWSLSNWLMRP